MKSFTDCLPRWKTGRVSVGLREMNEGVTSPDSSYPSKIATSVSAPPNQYAVVEYGDNGFPHFRNVFGAVNELVHELQDDLCYAFRDFPSRRFSSAREPASKP
jgi:hypothetical protein